MNKGNLSGGKTPLKSKLFKPIDKNITKYSQIVRNKKTLIVSLNHFIYVWIHNTFGSLQWYFWFSLVVLRIHAINHFSHKFLWMYLITWFTNMIILFVYTIVNDNLSLNVVIIVKTLVLYPEIVYILIIICVYDNTFYSRQKLNARQLFWIPRK